MAKAVIPAEAGIQILFWVPTFAGTTLPFSITRLPSKRTLFLATDIGETPPERPVSDPSIRKPARTPDDINFRGVDSAALLCSDLGEVFKW